MYVPAHFAETRPEVLSQFLHDHPFGLLITLGADGPDATQIPFLFERGAGGGVLSGHVARANPVWRNARTEVPVLVVFQGPHAYVTPSWYPTKAESGKVVPTWNYITVHARGSLRLREERDWLRQHVTQLTQRHEANQPVPWALDDAPADFVDTLLGAIVGIEISVHSLTGKWKLSQNRPAADRQGVASGLEARGDDTSLALSAEVARASRP